MSDPILDPDHREDEGEAFRRLTAIMARLRAPDGCPWDREQDLASLRPFLLEETYEVLEAIDAADAAAHREELGDLLLQVVFQSQIRSEEGSFTAAAVVHGICDKLVRRHPHVFGDASASSAADVIDRWEAIKAREKTERRSALDGVPRAMPALARAQRVQEKAARRGFDWPDGEGALEKLREEIDELREAVARGQSEARRAAELGDVLFSAVNVARHAGLSAEDVLRAAVERFEQRFRGIEARASAAGVRLEHAGSDRLDRWWEEVKRESSES